MGDGSISHFFFSSSEIVEKEVSAQLGERPTIARTPNTRRVTRAPDAMPLPRRARKERKQYVGLKTTLSQAWSGNCIRGPQCAFEMSMFMCPAVHKLTRN